MLITLSCELTNIESVPTDPLRQESQPPVEIGVVFLKVTPVTVRGIFLRTLGRAMRTAVLIVGLLLVMHPSGRGEQK